MNRSALMPVLVVVSVLLISFPAWGEGLEEVILSVTLSGGLAAGVEGSWGLDDHFTLRAGLSLLMSVDLTPVLWGRAVYLYNVNPPDRLSFYGGGGLSTMVALTAGGLVPMALLEIPLGVDWSLDERLGLLGELRFGLPWLHPLFGREIPTLILPIGLTAGLGYSTREPLQ